MALSGIDVMELDLPHELLRVAKQWPAVVAASALAAVLGFGITFLFQPVYQAEIGLQLGRVQGQVVGTQADITSLLTGEKIRSNLPHGSEIESVGAPDASGRFQVAVRGLAASDVMKGAHVVADSFLAGQRAEYESALEGADRYTDMLSRRLDAMMAVEQQGRRLAATEGSTMKSGDIATLMLLQTDNSQIVALSRELRDLRFSRATSTKPPRVVDLPALPTAPLWPRRAVFVTVAGIIGFAAALAFVLLRPIFERLRSMAPRLRGGSESV